VSGHNALIAVVCIGVALGVRESGAAQPPDRWEGRIELRGSTWPVRIDLTHLDDLRASVDFPALGVSGLDVEVKLAWRDTYFLTLPFGLGEHPLEVQESWAGTPIADRALAGIVIDAWPDPTPPPAEHDMEIVGDEGTLRGSLLVPAGADGPLPAIVVAHESDCVTRDKPEYRAWADLLTREGYVVVAYDKRGCGESTGVHDAASLQQLAGDLVEVVRWARARPEVDGSRVAALGWSQAGWVIPLAAQLEPLACAVLVAPPAHDPASLELQVLERVLREAQLDDEQFADATAYTRLYFSAARDPGLFEALAAMRERHDGAAWLELVPVPDSPEDQAWWGDAAEVDPARILAGDMPPTLALYGQRDDRVPAAQNAGRFERLMTEAGNEVRVLVYPEADHRLEVPSKRLPDGTLRFPQLAPGMIEEVTVFLAMHLGEGEDS